MNEKAAEAIQKSRRELERVGALLNNTEEGRLLLEVLEGMYYKGAMVGTTPHDTYFNLGRREVVDFLLDLRDKTAKEH